MKKKKKKEKRKKPRLFFKSSKTRTLKVTLQNDRFGQFSKLNYFK